MKDVFRDRVVFEIPEPGHRLFQKGSIGGGFSFHLVHKGAGGIECTILEIKESRKS